MSDDYPHEEDLELLRHWPTDQLPELLELIRRLWHWPENGVKIEGGMWRLATGGWSGNEDIIQALNDNTMFWILCWQRSERGGLHWFKPL